ncbi:RrF2 family transcriptional regulator [Aliikangiella sp. IMCC44359]|uniref:RrF2 family transcriptional regulator n=1 Tax=Aliikangiella sp. IMCC44359 TaxID=3459125 RepID=UPI00403AF111
MNVTRYTDYSLRVLMYLGINEGRLVTIKEIAESYDISKNHLMKIVQELNAKKYIIAVRGKNGGLKLNGEPCSINIGLLIRDIEQELSLVECFSNKNTCAITPACQLKSIFSEALDSFLSTLEQYTLADLLPPKTKVKLGEILNVRMLN